MLSRHMFSTKQLVVNRGIMTSDLPGSFAFFQELSSSYNSEAGRSRLRSMHEQLPNLIFFTRCLGESYSLLSNNSENLITDIGLRKSSEPFAFAKKYIRQIGDCKKVIKFKFDHFLYDVFPDAANEEITRFDHDEFVLNLIRNNEFTHLMQVLELYINFLGSWKDGYTISDSIFKYQHLMVINGQSLLLLNHVACILAIHADVRCRAVFKQLFSHLQDPYQLFFTSLRVAAAEIKRFRDPQRADHALKNLKHLASKMSEHEGYTKYDALFAEAVTLNLNALVHAYNGDFEIANLMINRSFGVDPKDLNTVDLI